MKRFLILTMILFPLLTACEEREPSLFEDMTGVYFNNTSGTMSVTDSLDVTFVYESSDLLSVPVKVQLLGRTYGQDRPLNITVSSGDAEEGVDYILPERAVLPAGASSVDYVVTLKRTPALKLQKKTISLRMHANEFFDLPVTELVQVSDTVSVLDFHISFSDMFTKAPSAWEESLVGDFTQQKFELICRVLGIDPDDFNDQGVITLAKLLYISAEMTAYVEEQVARKAAGDPFDEYAFDPVTGEPLTFR